MGYKFNIVNNWLGGTTIIRNYKNGDGGFELVTPYNIKTFDTLESVFNFKQFRYKVAEPLQYPIYLKFTYKDKSYDIFKFTDEFTSEHKFASKSFKNLDGSIYKWIHSDYCDIISSYDYYELFNKRVGNIRLHNIPSAESIPIFKNIQEIYGQSIYTHFKTLEKGKYSSNTIYPKFKNQRGWNSNYWSACNVLYWKSKERSL